LAGDLRSCSDGAGTAWSFSHCLDQRSKASSGRPVATVVSPDFTATGAPVTRSTASKHDHFGSLHKFEISWNFKSVFDAASTRRRSCGEAEETRREK